MKNNIDWKTSSEKINYPDAVSFMEDKISQIKNGKANSLIWLAEHPPIYTAGISAREGDLLDTHKDIPVFKTARGGKHTYHGPGIRMIYLMLDLKTFFAPEVPDIHKFVEFLENWVIATLVNFGITGEIRKGRVGIWVKTPVGNEKKIAAIGIKVKQGVVYHGVALNVNPDLNNFKGIVPCGISQYGVTSLHDLGINANFSEVDEALKKEFYKTLLQ